MNNKPDQKLHVAATVRKGPRAAAACIAVGPARGAVVGRAGLADVLCLLCSSPTRLRQ